MEEEMHKKMLESNVKYRITIKQAILSLNDG